MIARVHDNPESARASSTPSVGRATSRAAEMLSLQARLLLRDARRSAASLRSAGLAAAVAVALGVGVTPVLLAALALTIRDASGWSLAESLFASGCLALVVAAACASVAYRLSGDAARVLARAYEDLEATLGCFVPDAHRAPSNSPDEERRR